MVCNWSSSVNIMSMSTKLLSLSSSFLLTPHPSNSFRTPPLRPLTPTPTALTVYALILPPSSSSPSLSSASGKQLQQQLYQPYRPPPSPLPAKYRSLDTAARLDILTNRLGLWFEYAPIITSLLQEGFISTTIEEITGITSLEQNRLVVAAQVRDSLVESTDDETVSYFDGPASPELLYEIRILNTPQRALAARFIIANGFDGKSAEELARSMKDYPRRYGERAWESFDGNLPGDCLAFMYFRQAQEHKNASSPELSKTMLERALEVAETERAKQRVIQDMEGAEEEEEEGIDELVRVPVVRMAYGEVAQSSTIVVLPVCKKDAELEEAPWECGMGGEFGVVEAEKEWRRWVVLPGWGPVAGLKRGGVAVVFPKARGVLPWKMKKKDAEEEILVVVDRGAREVESEEGFYLVVGGGNGRGEERLQVERGVNLMANTQTEEETNPDATKKKSLGSVVLVVKPPREEVDPLSDVDWD